MDDLIHRFDASRNLDGVPSVTRDYGSGVTGTVSITFGSGQLDWSHGVFGTRYQYRYTARYEWLEIEGKQSVLLSRDYHSVAAAWEDVDKFASRKQRELFYR